MNLTQSALDNNRVTIMVLLVIILMGIGSYQSLSRDSMPPYTIRVATVVTIFPGAGPERIESLITSKIEEVAQELPELDNVTSESRTGLSVVSVSLKDEVGQAELQAVWDRLRRKIDGIQSDLPEGITGPKVNDDGLGVVYGIIVGLQGDGFSYAELKEYAETIRDDIIKLPDASQVELAGIQEEQIFLEFDDARLAELGLSGNQIKNYISNTNIVFPGGEVSLGNERIVLEPTGSFEQLEDLGRVVIPVGNGSVNLGDITRIVRDYKTPAQSLVSINGKPGVGISIALREGANIIKLGQEVDAKLDAYRKELPIGLEVLRAASQDTEVDKSVNDFIGNLLQSVVIVLATMLLFLGLRTGLVVASLIPVTIVMTLFIMGIINVGLNQVSLAALIMALGMLVDNAIVMSESILVKMEAGETARQAAIDSAGELTIPLLISSLTTSAAFLSFFLAESTMGEIVGPLFVVITIALLSSWLLSLSMVTLLATYLIRVNKKAEKSKPDLFERANAYYKRLLLWALKSPALFIVLIVGALVLSLYGFTKLPFIFFPDSERNLVTLDMNLPLGTKIERTEKVVAEIEDWIVDSLLVGEQRSKGIIDWSAFVGEGPSSYDLGYQPGEANSGYAHMLLNTSSGDDNQMIINRLNAYSFRSFPDAEVRVARLAGGGGGGSDVAVRVSGPEPDQLFRIAEQIKAEMLKIPGSQNIGDDWGPKIKKFIINIDQNKANRAGISNQDIALSLQTALSGFRMGAFREGENNIPIMFLNERNEDLEIGELESVSIFAQGSGRNVPLTQVAEILPAWQYAKIKRRDLFRTMTVDCDAMEGFTATDITDILNPRLAELKKEWPSAYNYELGGEAESSSDAMGAVIDQLPLSGFIILLLLILQFNSFRKTVIVLSTIPLGLIGVVAGLLSFQSYFGFFAFLGLISLAGILINNAIVLIDRIQIELTEMKREPADAIIAAAQQRFRPILLTTFTTTLGLIPLYLGGGLMWEPMAIAIMIGLLFATVITLLFVPVLYRIFFRV
ncbi:MAG: efflux RND transporter permease subunit, partial [Bacteroidota bacterium]